MASSRYELQTQCEQIAAKLLVVEARAAGAPAALAPPDLLPISNNYSASVPSG